MSPFLATRMGILSFFCALSFGVPAQTGMPGDVSDIVREMAQRYPGALERSATTLDYGDDVSWEFLDRVIQRLHSIDPRFGYRQAIMKGQSVVSFDSFAYYEGEGDPTGASEDELVMFDILWGTPEGGRGVWMGRPDNPSPSRWVYPRPAMPVYEYTPPETPLGRQVDAADRPAEGVREGEGGELAGLREELADIRLRIEEAQRQREHIYSILGVLARSVESLGALHAVESASKDASPVCPADRVEPDYRLVGRRCLPSCGQAVRLACRPDGSCSGWRMSTRASVCSGDSGESVRAVGEHYEEACCLVKESSAIDQLLRRVRSHRS